MSNFMKRAVELSIENVRERGGGPFGCVIVKNNEIIAEGIRILKVFIAIS